MIDANMYVKIEFDEEGRKKIEDAIFTIQDILDAINKVGGDTSGMAYDLEQAKSYLQAILDKEIW